MVAGLRAPVATISPSGGSGFALQQLHGRRVLHAAAHAPADEELHEPLRRDVVTDQSRPSAVDDEVGSRPVAEGDREGIGAHVRHVFVLEHGIAQQHVGLAP